jgi:transcriptional regulator with XRE-family HTH domain
VKKRDYAKISSDNVKFLIAMNNLSIRQLADKIGVAPTTLNDSLKSKKGVAIDSLIEIADYFNVTVNDLCNPDFSINLTEKNQINFEQLKNKYQQLDNHGKSVVSVVLDAEFERLLEERNKT